MEVVLSQTDNKIRSRCKNVERHLRLAVSDWYYLLSRLALSSDTWLYEWDWWMKQVPSQLDIPWAFDSLETSIRRPGALTTLLTRVDQICLSIEREQDIDFPKRMKELKTSLELLREDAEDAGLAV